MQLSTAHARKQLDIVSGQNKELWTLAQKVLRSRITDAGRAALAELP
jgi:hypothetical protein